MGATLVDFNFTTQAGDQASQAPSTVALGLTASELARGAGMRNNANLYYTQNGFSTRTPAGSTTTSNDTLGEAVTQNVFATFNITVGAGQELNLTSLDFGWATQHASSRTFSLLVAFNDAAFTTANEVSTPVTITTDNLATAPAIRSFDLTGVSSLQNISAGTKIEFRLYLYTEHDEYPNDALSSGGSAPGLDLVGTVSAIPEPSTFAMLLGGLGTLALLRRRRRLD